MIVKVGRNDLCPCGSGKKYKKCCLNIGHIDYLSKFRNIIEVNNYSENLSSVLHNLFCYIKDKNWIGACHATSACLYVALSVIGYSPKLCIGEVKCRNITFDHSWIELDGKIIDLAISMPLINREVSAPIILNIDTDTNQDYNFKYGIIDKGLGFEAKTIMNLSFEKYMDNFPESKNGLWDVVDMILPNMYKLDKLHNKYDDVQWNYIK